MIKIVVGLALASVTSAVSVAAAQHEDPDVVKCQVPWLTAGRWTDCVPEDYRDLGQECTFETPFNEKCTYDGAIACNKDGNFEKYDADGKSIGPNKCQQIPHPPDGLGCAKFDQEFDTCTSTEGCHWDGTRSVCDINCRKTGCGTEFHRRDNACFFNCPLHNATECAPWQAGCGCIQDSPVKDCASWCTTNNQEKYIWLPKASVASNSFTSQSLVKADLQTVSESLEVSNAGGYDTIQLCQDACFQRGVCVSPKVVV